MQLRPMRAFALPPILSFALQKLLRLGLLLLAVAVFTFVLLSLSPIDPVQAYIGADMMQISPEQRGLIAERWGLDQPMPVRFWDWLGQLMQGNWGTSLVFNQPVATVIANRFQASLQMLAIAWLLSGLLGLGLGIVAGALAGGWCDRIIRLYAYTLASAPTFWVALLLLITFSVSLRVTPICCAAPPGVLAADITIWQHLHHLLLPAITLSVIGIANIALHTRQKLIDVLHSDYVLFARAQGESLGGVVRHHGLRNMPPSANCLAVRCWWSRCLPTQGWGRPRCRPPCAAMCRCWWGLCFSAPCLSTPATPWPIWPIPWSIRAFA
jgi:peptide/nickel transport system permease protein